MVGVVALILTVSMTVPFASILIGAILLRRDYWREIVLLSSLGSATGGVVLYLIFHHWGWTQLADGYPELVQSKAWSDATTWVSVYGTWALLAIAATPLPQTPALVFTAGVAVAAFGGLPRALDRKIAEIRHLRISRCQISILVRLLRIARRRRPAW